MFSAMIAALQSGRLPAAAELRPRLQMALVKKNGVLQQPRSCWSNDPKSNPDSRHLLWAAILLEDQEGLNMTIGIIFLEQGKSLAVLTPETARTLLRDQSAALLALALTPELSALLTAKINKAAATLYRP